MGPVSEDTGVHGNTNGTDRRQSGTMKANNIKFVHSTSTIIINNKNLGRVIYVTEVRTTIIYYKVEHMLKCLNGLYDRTSRNNSEGFCIEWGMGSSVGVRLSSALN